MTAWETRPILFAPSLREHEGLRATDGTVPPEEIEQHLRRTLQIATVIAWHIEDQIYVTSLWRTERTNRIAGGSPKSLHLEGHAFDGTAWKRWKPGYVYEAIEDMIHEGLIPDGGLGLYKDRIHYDSRCTLGLPPARWGKG